MFRRRNGRRNGMPQPGPGLDELMIVNPAAGDGLAVFWGRDGRLHSLRPLPASGGALLEICLMDAAGRIYRPVGKLANDR